MMQLCDLLIVTLLFAIFTVNCDPIKRSSRSSHIPQSATSNMAPYPWYGSPWFPYGQPNNFPMMPPMPDAQTIMKNVQDQIKATRDNIQRQIAQNSVENTCEPVDVTTDNFTVGNTNYTVVKKTCKGVNGGPITTTSTIITQDASGSNSGSTTSSTTTSGSAQGSSVASATTSDSVPSQSSSSTSDTTSSSSSGGAASATQTNQETNPEAQSQSIGSNASSASMASSGNGGAVASAVSAK